MAVLSRNELLKTVSRLKGKGLKIVTTNGCFDILHVGHTRYLKAARGLGDVLVVLVNTDASVRGNKGSLRPVVPEDERAEILDALECVDYVVLFNKHTPIELLSLIQPDIHVKGGNYRVDQLPEAPTVQSFGGEVVVVQHVKGKSTTNLIADMVAVWKGIR